MSTGKTLAESSFDLAIDVSEFIRPESAPGPTGDQEQGRLLLIPAGDSRDVSYWRDSSQIHWTSSSPQMIARVLWLLQDCRNDSKQSTHRTLCS